MLHFIPTHLITAKSPNGRMNEISTVNTSLGYKSRSTVTHCSPNWGKVIEPGMARYAPRPPFPCFHRGWKLNSRAQTSLPKTCCLSNSMFGTPGALKKRNSSWWNSEVDLDLDLTNLT